MLHTNFFFAISPLFYQFNTFLPARDAGLDHAVVHQRSQCVHEEDRKHHTFGIGRIDHTDQHGERTGEESDDILARTGLGRRDGIGGHEHGAESETADDQMLPSGVGRHAECLEKVSHCQAADKDERHRAPRSDARKEQNRCADQNRQRRSFAHAAGNESQESRIFQFRSVFEKCFDADVFSYNSRKITSNFTNNSSHFREKMWYDKTVHSFL